MMGDGNEAEARWEPLDQDGFFALMGPVQARFDGDGAARFRFETNASHKNRGGFLHGGVLLALADQVMGRTARQREPERNHATMQIDMQFISAAPIGAVIELRCKVVAARRTVEFVEAHIFGDGELIATARGIWRNFGPPVVPKSPPHAE